MQTLLFVHIGTEYPSYLLSNIERTRALFSENKIALVGEKRPKEKWLIKYRVTFKAFVRNENFDLKFSYDEFEKNFRSGYWRHTLERLVSIESYHRDFPTEKVIHVESDVILFANFPFDEIGKLEQVNWMNHSAKADIATLVFSPSWIASRNFVSDLIEEYSLGGGSDMDVLLRMRQKSNSYSVLPTLNKETMDFANSANLDIDKFYDSIDSDFEGIFDAAVIGMWVSGVDPRNKFGFTVIHSRELIDSGTVFIDPTKMKFSLTSDCNLLLVDHKYQIPIYNLHIHSKNKKLLSLKWKRRLFTLIRNEKPDPQIIAFSIPILLKLIKSNFENQSLRNFILQIPIVKKIRLQSWRA